HEIGISIAHTGYHRHSAYILANADMPGFSRLEQAQLSLLTRAHRGALSKLLNMVNSPSEWPLILVLRLAVLLCRSRSDAELPPMKLKFGSNGFSLTMDRAWLEHNPLTRALLENESKEWKSIGMSFLFKPEKNTPNS
ncbi:MAG: exopolyphosphatase, partial [Sulfurimicrobium sp.]|nr:exopolyphosphatase [Sulfurimicrobium sp.]